MQALGFTYLLQSNGGDMDRGSNQLHSQLITWIIVHNAARQANHRQEIKTYG